MPVPQVSKGGRLVFSYRVNEGGREYFKSGHTVFLSDVCNILEAEGGNTTNAHLTNLNAVEEVYLKGCRKALEAAWGNRSGSSALCPFRSRTGIPALHLVPETLLDLTAVGTKLGYI